MAALPPGQREIVGFPRFGLPEFAGWAPATGLELRLTLADGRGQSTAVAGSALEALPRVEQISDLHCVTTWSSRGLRWSGYRFQDFYERILVPVLRPDPAAGFVVFRCLDGYSITLLREDALRPDVLLADRLDGHPLPVAHGAPMRVVAPAQYGYKSSKHLASIEFRHEYRSRRSWSRRLIDHPRARVTQEERGRIVPGWILRCVYRPLVAPTLRRFQEGRAG